MARSILGTAAIVIGVTLLFQNTATANPSGACVYLRGGYDTFGAQDYVKIPANAAYDFTTNAFTFAFWAYNFNWDNYCGLLNKGGTDDEFDQANRMNVCVGIQMGSSGRNPPTNGYLIYYVNTAAGGDTSAHPPTNYFMPKSWHHVMLTYDGDTARLYLDSRLDNKYKAGTPLLACSGLAIYLGLDFPGSIEYLKGCFDELMIWNRALPPSDTAAVRAGNISGLQSGLVGHWNFNEGQGDTIHDSSPTGNPGVLRTWTSGGPKWILAGYPVLDTSAVATPVVQSRAAAQKVAAGISIARLGGSAYAITYCLVKPALTRIEILDVSGKTVAVHEAGRLGAGTHTSRVDLGNRQPGTYLVRVKGGAFVEQRTVAVIE